MENPEFPIWQRNYLYGRSALRPNIRNESELEKIREYIQSNPAMWPARNASHSDAGGDRDRNNPENPLFKNVKIKI